MAYLKLVSPKSLETSAPAGEAGRKPFPLSVLRVWNFSALDQLYLYRNECRVETLTLSLRKTTRRCCAVPAVRRLRCGACGAVPAVRNGAVRHDGASHGGHVLGERSSRTHSTD